MKLTNFQKQRKEIKKEGKKERKIGKGRKIVKLRNF